LLNPAVASTLKNRLDVGRYRNPLGASSINVEVPFPLINGNQFEFVFSLILIIGNVFVLRSGAFTVISPKSIPVGAGGPPPPIAYTQ
jgi:hypothetical protein